MNGKAGALAFLIVRTTRNRIVKQVSRVRNPRYAFALLFGIGYLWLTFFRPGAMPRRGNASLLPGMDGAIISILLYLTIALTWLMGRAAGSLAFLPAEVHFLFPGPLTRRQLIAYRMVRSQLVVVLNAVVWSVLLRRFGVTIPAPIRFGSAWALFSVLSLHQLGAALVLVPPASGRRRIAGWAARGLAAISVVVMVIGLAPVLSRLGDLGGLDQAMQALTTALAAPPVGTVLAPFRLLAAPILTTTTGAWLGAMGAVLLVIGAHVAWVLAMDVRFADAAVAASAKRAARMAALKASRSGTAVAPKSGKVTRQWLPLAPIGHPAIAIAWKNTMALIRGGGTRTLALLLAIGIPFLVISQAGGSRDPGGSRGLAALPYLTIVAMTMLMGPRMLRNDLRQDLLRLSTLKTFPLTGRVLVAGELISPTLVLSAFQLLLLAVCYATVPAAAKLVGESGLSSLGLVLVPLVLLSFNGVNVAIQNGVTLMFPSWVRLGADSGGIEAMGQNLLMTFGSMFALMLALLLPVGAAAAIIILVRATSEAGMGPALIAGTTVGVLLLVGEIVAMVNIFGRSFERMDPTAIG